MTTTPQPLPPTIPDAALRRAPPRQQLAVIAEAVRPGSVVSTVTRLRGGVSSGMHAVQLRGPSDQHTWVVVRRYGRWRVKHDPQVAEREWATLAALARVAAPSPRPLWLDAEGVVCGCPTIVTTRVPGRGLLAPRDPLAFTRGLATALAAIHNAPLEAAELAVLADQRDGPARLLERDAPPPDLAALPRISDVWTMLHRWWPRVRAALAAGPPRLVHGDFWPGNTLWRYGRLSGVVDWEQVRRGDPAQDVGYCRLDLTLLFGPEAAASFLSAYRATSGLTASHLYFWELSAAIWATEGLEEWVKGYHDLGRTDLLIDEARARLGRFIDEALARAAAALSAAGTDAAAPITGSTEELPAP
jgi:aminoglycoside phosphotransferase (APT) family kinase protein